MAGFFDTLFGGGAEREAAERNRAVTQQYGTEAQGYLTGGYNTGVGNLNQAINAYNPLSTLATKYGGASDLYLDALGVNGPAGNTRAINAFQTTPGYTLARDQGLEALDRRRAITGMYASGNADQDALNYTTNLLYSTQYQPWITNLANAGQQGGQYATTAATGQAAGYGSLANLAQQYASSQAGVAGNVAGGLTSANNLQAQGEASGAKNLLGAGLSLASLAMAPLTGGTSLLGMAGQGLKNLNLGQSLFGGGSPTGYG